MPRFDLIDMPSPTPTSVAEFMSAARLMITDSWG